MTHPLQGSSLRERIIDSLGYSCGGLRCPHEIIGDHWVMTGEHINVLITTVQEEMKQKCLEVLPICDDCNAWETITNLIV